MQPPVEGSAYLDLPRDVQNILLRSLPVIVLQRFACVDRAHLNQVWNAQVSLDFTTDVSKASTSEKTSRTKCSLPRLQQLQSLTLGKDTIYQLDLLTCLTNLRSLTATDIAVDAPLTHLTTLTHLDVNKLPKGFFIAPLINLTHFDLRRARLSISTVAMLPNLKKLKTLLISTSIPLEMFEPFCAHASLRTLAAGTVFQRGTALSSEDFGHFEMIHKYGNKLMLLTDKGDTYWSWTLKASSHESLVVLKHMFEKFDKIPCLDINAASYSGRTALHNCITALRSTGDNLKALLQWGADANIPFPKLPFTLQDNRPYVRLQPNGLPVSDPSILPVLASFFFDNFDESTYRLLWNATKDPYSSLWSPSFAAVLSLRIPAIQFVRSIETTVGYHSFVPHVIVHSSVGVVLTNALHLSVSDGSRTLESLLSGCGEHYQLLDAPLLKEIFSQKDPSGRTGLHYLCDRSTLTEDSTEILRFFLRLGLDNCAPDANGITPLDLHLAKCSGKSAYRYYLKEFDLPPEQFMRYHRESAHRHICSILSFRSREDVFPFIQKLVSYARRTKCVEEMLQFVFADSDWPSFAYFACVDDPISCRTTEGPSVEEVAARTWINAEDIESACEQSLSGPPKLKFWGDPRKWTFCSHLGVQVTKQANFLVRALRRLNSTPTKDDLVAWIRNGTPVKNPKALLMCDYHTLLLAFEAGVPTRNVQLADIRLPETPAKFSEYLRVLLFLLEKGCDINAAPRKRDPFIKHFVENFRKIEKANMAPFFSLIVKYGVVWPLPTLNLVKFAILNGAGVLELRYFLSQASSLTHTDTIGIWRALILEPESSLSLPQFAISMICDLLVEYKIYPPFGTDWVTFPYWDKIHEVVQSRIPAYRTERLLAVAKLLQVLSNCCRFGPDQETSFRDYVIGLLSSSLWKVHKQNARSLWTSICNLPARQSEPTGALLIQDPKFLQELVTNMLGLPDCLPLFLLLKSGIFKPLENTDLYMKIKKELTSFDESKVEIYLQDNPMCPLDTTASRSESVAPTGAAFGFAINVAFGSPFGASGATPASSSSSLFGSRAQPNLGSSPPVLTAFSSPASNTTPEASKVDAPPSIFTSPQPLSPLSFSGLAALPPTAPLVFGSSICSGTQHQSSQVANPFSSPVNQALVFPTSPPSAAPSSSIFSKGSKPDVKRTPPRRK